MVVHVHVQLTLPPQIASSQSSQIHPSCAENEQGLSCLFHTGAPWFQMCSLLEGTLNCKSRNPT